MWATHLGVDRRSVTDSEAHFGITGMNEAELLAVLEVVAPGRSPRTVASICAAVRWCATIHGASDPVGELAEEFVAVRREMHDEVTPGVLSQRAARTA